MNNKQAKNNYIAFKEALDLIKKTKIDKMQSQKIFINQSVGRILANDILASESMPRFNTSNMDGYAFNYSDLEVLQTMGLRIDSINKAGNNIECEIKTGVCIKTFTGAKMPKNADALVIVEDVIVKDNRIFLKENIIIKKGNYIRKIGENYKKDEILLEKNNEITAFDIGILAQNNNIFVEVYQKPKVAILASGDEIIEIGEIPQNNNYIYSSNNHVLNAIIESLGAVGSIYPIIKDSKDCIKEAIQLALQANDIVITTGGMSKGDFDFTKDIIKEFGEVVFEGVKIKPGKVMSYIKCDKNKHILALPGNPVSAMVSFLLFGRLVLQKMFNLESNINIHKAKLLSDIEKTDKERMEFGLCKLSLNNGFYEVSLLKNRQSYMINNFNGAMVLIDKDLIKKNDLVDIILLNELIKI